MDDITGQEGATPVSFTFGGVEFVIDLSPESIEKFHAIVAPYMAAATIVRSAKKSHKAARDVQGVREWARANGYTVGARGAVSSAVRAAYEAR